MAREVPERYDLEVEDEDEDEDVEMEDDPDWDFDPNQIVDIGPFVNEPAARQVQQEQLVIEGIQISFPGQPYQNQLQIMGNIIRCLNNEEHHRNVLIESPTGSGKTLAILCALLGWTKHQNRRNAEPEGRETKKFTIYYTTRTHAQVSTVVKELRKTSYAAPNNDDPHHSELKVAILGSRKQLCTNQDVILNEEREPIDDACKRLCSNSEQNLQQRNLETCPYYRPPIEGENYFTRNEDGAICDMEDLVSAARHNSSCAYFGSRRQLPLADIIICPYNYLISTPIRKSMGINLSCNSIVVFDEGHNLEKIFCEEGSISITTQKLHHILGKCKEICNQPHGGNLIANRIQSLYDILSRFYKWMTDPQTPPQVKEPILVAFREHLQPNPEAVIITIENDIDYVINTKNMEREPTLDTKTARDIKKFVSVLKYVYSGGEDDMILKNYFLQLQDVERQQSGAFLNRKLNIICLKPAIVFQAVSNHAHSILVFSGTLSPLSTLSETLGIHFEEPLTLGQEILSHRYWVGKVGSGPNGLKLHLKFSSREKLEVIKELGEIVLKVSQEVPNGILVFFPSKKYFEKVKNHWGLLAAHDGRGTIMDGIKQLKHVVCETDMTTSEKARDLLNSYREESVNDGRGAILFGIYRGKVSEGVDFRDKEARAVISFGIPYAPKKAPDIAAREFSTSTDEFWKWYHTNAIRALSQCLGRSVRHRGDWGAIIMVDQRLIDKAAEFQGLMPLWMENDNKDYQNFDEMILSLRNFVQRVRNLP